MISTPLLQVLLFVGVGVGFILSALFLSRLIAPARPNAEKNASYESGEPAKGSAWPSISTGYYVIALLFLLFEVEIIMLFPLVVRLDSTSANSAAWVLAEIVGFVVILAVGLAYAWANGHLDWMKPSPKENDFKSPVPRDRYEEFNRRYN